MIRLDTLGRWAMKYYWRHKEWAEAQEKLKEIREEGNQEKINQHVRLAAILTMQMTDARKNLLKYCAQAAGNYPDER